jgi:general secretion pathway protein A
MYEAFFGLQTKPFELVPNPRFLFLSQSHRKALSYLRYGLQERAGFILLTGEVGSGKTTIIRDLVGSLTGETRLALVFNTRVTPEQLIAMINEEFGLAVDGKDKVALLRELNDFLIAAHSRGGQPVVIIDEAQNLSAEALEEVRLLSNLEADSFKLLQIILVGQPELKGIIAQESLRQLRQRIGINCHIEPLSREEAQAYVYHRLETAGNRDAVNFYPGTFEILYNFSQGIPRLINVFCDFILLAAFVEETRDLSLELVEEVIGDVAWEQSQLAPAPAAQLPGPQPLEPILARLDRLEGRMAQIDAGQFGSEHFAQRLSAQEAILKKLVERQESDFRRLEGSLEKIAEALAGMGREEKAVERPRPVIAAPVELPKRGLLARIFG